LIEGGVTLFDESAGGPELTEDRIEAAIAAIHANARRAEHKHWS
jgi:predicted RNA polymerase sigma factor